VPSLFDLALPPRLLMRALDDVHAIAEAARRLPTIEALLTEQFEILNRQADDLIRIGESVIEMGTEANARLGDGIEVGRMLHERGEALMAAGERLLEQGAQMERRAAQLDGRAVEMKEQSDLVIAAAREVAERGAEVAAALPTLEQLAATTEPLQPAIERFSRMVDRLPGGKPPRE
jgi:hypothetical protein